MEKALFLALDVDSVNDALKLADQTSEFVSGYKVGPRLLIQSGQTIIKKLAERKPVFVDNKYLDIPNTMVQSVKATFKAGASFCTIHTQCSAEALKKLYQLEQELNQIRSFKILCVTILTSYCEETLPVTQIKKPIVEQVKMLVQQAYKYGLKSFVCSAFEVKALTKEFPDCYFVTPGIRFKNEDSGDQKRVVDPETAIQWGANAIVVGRPICESSNVRQAAEKYYNAIKGHS